MKKYFLLALLLLPLGVQGTPIVELRQESPFLIPELKNQSDIARQINENKEIFNQSQTDLFINQEQVEANSSLLEKIGAKQKTQVKKKKQTWGQWFYRIEAEQKRQARKKQTWGQWLYRIEAEQKRQARKKQTWGQWLWKKTVKTSEWLFTIKDDEDRNTNKFKTKIIGSDVISLISVCLVPDSIPFFGSIALGTAVVSAKATSYLVENNYDTITERFRDRAETLVTTATLASAIPVSFAVAQIGTISSLALGVLAPIVSFGLLCEIDKLLAMADIPPWIDPFGGWKWLVAFLTLKGILPQNFILLCPGFPRSGIAIVIVLLLNFWAYNYLQKKENKTKIKKWYNRQRSILKKYANTIRSYIPKVKYT